jgi:hypothetical protein
MSTIKVDTITDEAGSGAPDFPNGMTGNGSSLTGLATAAQGALANTALQSSSSLAAANLTGALPAIDGSALTSLTSGNLTGALPAIDGSALTGVGASTDSYAVGTYALASAYSSSNHNIGNTVAGSSLFSWQMYSSSNVSGGSSTTGGQSVSGSFEGQGSTSFTGTWRWMSASAINGTRTRAGLAVRIS